MSPPTNIVRYPQEMAMELLELLNIAQKLRRQADETNLHPYPGLLNRVADELEAEAGRLRDNARFGKPVLKSLTAKP